MRLLDRQTTTVRFRALAKAVTLVWKSGPGLAAAGIAVTTLQSLLPAAALWTTKLLVDAVQASVAHGNQPSAKVALYIGLAAGLATLFAMARAISGWLRVAQGQAFADYIADRVHRQSVAVDLAYYDDARYFDTLHLAQQEGAGRPIEIIESGLLAVRNAISLLSVMAILMSFHWGVALALGFAAIPGAWVRVRASRAFYDWRKRMVGDERRASYLHWLMVDGGTAADIRLLGLGGLLTARFHELRRTIRRWRLDHARRTAATELALQLMAVAVVFAVFLVMAHSVLAGRGSLGDLVMYFLALQRGQDYLNELLDSLGRLYEASLFIDSIDTFLALPRSGEAGPDERRPVPEGVRDIAVEHLSFAYPGTGRPVLRDVSLEVPAGTTVALVGANGSGKSTLVKLLCRLYEPDAGVIAYGGVDTRRFPRAAWQANLGVMLQDYTRYHLSARDNIAFGDIRRPSDPALIEAAARASGIDETLRRLPNGYETILSRMFPEGTALSLGQWQRVALARIAYRDAPIVILDEPTSALDVYTEYDLFTRLKTLLKGRTIIVVSHRFTTVRGADSILVMEAGRITERGSHDRLMRAGGVYAEMFRLQAESYRP